MFNKSERADLLHAKCKIFSKSVCQYAILTQIVDFIILFNENFGVTKNVEWFQKVTISKINYYELFKAKYPGILQRYKRYFL